ncbi:hypothetical protein [Magnetofaba australis]|uniref:Uncharacterized protein n=1 Tax=Magnetofaba australis IT-1 TaxID=1434232 RepID=A0A1Y2KAF3_9PROT|nr:hypothetical protein [Magnetofaba australis]OSM07687.1 hypothetical protein MAIT1_04544 [Magnetofaba australis IT-1]
MIHEFALDPEMVARWHDRGEYAFFAGRFGMDAGRVVSGYPKKWRQMVRKAFFDQFPAGDHNAEMRMEALLDTLCEKMVKRPSSFPELPTWLEKAEGEHGERPFRGILSHDNPRNRPFIITTDELAHGTITDEKNARHWEVPPAPSPPRDAGEFAQVVAPILRCCQHAVFVDPHFDPDPYRPRFLNTLREMLAILWGQNHGLDAPQAELHISADKKGESEILRKCRAHLPDVISQGGKLRVVIWKSRAGGEKLHNRYLLTDIGSVGFGVGLDEADEAGHDESDDLFRLSSAQHAKRWGQYVSAPAFELASDPIDVSR